MNGESLIHNLIFKQLIDLMKECDIVVCDKIKSFQSGTSYIYIYIYLYAQALANL